MSNWETIDQVMKANKDKGGYWFEPDTMQFFNSRIESGIIHGRNFITSEKPPHGPRAYTIRYVHDDASITTVGELLQYETLEDALEGLNCHKD